MDKLMEYFNSLEFKECQTRECILPAIRKIVREEIIEGLSPVDEVGEFPSVSYAIIEYLKQNNLYKEKEEKSEDISTHSTNN